MQNINMSVQFILHLHRVTDSLEPFQGRNPSHIYAPIHTLRSISKCQSAYRQTLSLED